jgi:hypothetical protein
MLVLSLITCGIATAERGEIIVNFLAAMIIGCEGAKTHEKCLQETSTIHGGECAPPDTRQ